jgi:hypothetical protein
MVEMRSDGWLVRLGESLAHEHHSRHLNWIERDVIEHSARLAAEHHFGKGLDAEAIEVVLRAYEREWELVTLGD